MKRGEIWSVAGPGYASKPRPALILQDDLFDGTESITIALITGHDAAASLTRVRIAATKTTGLAKESFVMTDKIVTVPRANVHERIGRLPPASLTEVGRAVMIFLGLIA